MERLLDAGPQRIPILNVDILTAGAARQVRESVLDRFLLYAERDDRETHVQALGAQLLHRGYGISPARLLAVSDEDDGAATRRPAQISGNRQQRIGNGRLREQLRLDRAYGALSRRPVERGKRNLQAHLARVGQHVPERPQRKGHLFGKYL